MKKLNLKKKLNFRSFALLGIFTFAVLAVGCEKENEEFYPESVSENADLKSAKSLAKGDLSIAEIALADDDEFDELVSALLYVDTELNAGLVDLFLNGTDQYTVFAPTDEAFEALYEVLGVNGIYEVDAQTVLNVLLYHVTEGRRAANSVVPKKNPRTIETLLEGSAFSVDSEAKIWAVGNSAMILSPNISASNGIIHVIDTVILPITL
jgi:transforming growth factor-beta-induced protein